MNENQIVDIIQQGITDAEKAVAQGEGNSVEDLVHYHYLKTTNDDRIADKTYGEFLAAKMAREFDFEEFSMKDLENHPSYIQYQLRRD